MELVPVPDDVQDVARAALVERANRGGGGTARGLVIATALTTGFLHPRELAELRAWHRANPNAVQGAMSTLIGGMYGGAPARAAYCARTAAALNPDGQGAMIALPVPDEIAAQVARPDGEPADEMHITLFFFGSDAATLDPSLHDTLRRLVEDFAARTPPPQVQLTHVERFTAGDEGLEPVVLVDDGPSVHRLREQLQEELARRGITYANDHAFRCHVTIGYYLPGDGPDSGPLPSTEGNDGGYEWTPDALMLHWGEDVLAVPFGGEARGDLPATAAISEPLEPVESPSGNRLRQLSRTLATQDRDLRLRLHAAAQAAYEEALRQAGVKVISRARGEKARTAAIAAVNARQVTSAVCAAVGVEERELLDGRLSTFAALAAGWISTAERKKLAAAARALGLDVDALDAEYGDTIDTRAAAASGFLAAGLGVLARAALAGTRPDTPQGEQAGPVPYGLIRDATLIGATGAAAPAFDESGPGPGSLEQLGTRIPKTASTLTEELLERTGTRVQVRSTWTVGDPDRPFEPHQALDGISWVDTQPDELAWDPGEFPYVDVLQPGDHDGCLCEIVEEYEPYEGTGAPADLSSIDAAEGLVDSLV